VNNNGIFTGVHQIDAKKDGINSVPVTGLSPAARYELLGEAFGGVGHSVWTPEELEKVLQSSFKDDWLSVINLHIDPAGFKKP